MALSMGTGPFGEQPSGRFDVEPPRRPLHFWEPFAKRVRAVVGGQTLVDSRRVMALHETGKMMRLCVPSADVRREHMPEGSWADAPVAALRDYVCLDLEKVDAWYQEDDLGYAHPRDPYHRVDVHRTTRRVTVRAGDTLIAQTSAPAVLFETSLSPRFYFSPDAVETMLLEKSETVSQCPYKGDGQHWHVVIDGRRIEDAGWNLVTPLGDALLIPRWYSFYPEKVRVEVDGEALAGT